MNAVHLHLVTNHAPLFGLIAAILLLGWGVARNSREFRIAAYAAFVLSSIAAIVAYLSGGAAESVVEDLPGITEGSIERHQEAATAALALISVAGIGSIVAFFVERGALALRKTTITALFAVALIALGVVGYAANLGGLIHHTEITAHK